VNPETSLHSLRASVLYDSLGRADEVVTNFDGRIYYEKTTFDQYGQVFQVFDAAGNGSYINQGALDRLTSQSVSGESAVTLSYDAVGNVTNKSDVGSYSYGAGSAGPHSTRRNRAPVSLLSDSRGLRQLFVSVRFLSLLLFDFPHSFL